MKINFIYVTFGNLKEAKKMGGQLVKNKLAACTNIIPTIYSIYVWKNKTMMDKECSMIVKTSKSKVKAAIEFIVKKHSYECPAVSAFPIESAHVDFKKWINEQVMG
mgnify:FL=1